MLGLVTVQERPIEVFCEGGALVEKDGGHVGKQSLTRSKGAESRWVVFTNERLCIGNWIIKRPGTEVCRLKRKRDIRNYCLED